MYRLLIVIGLLVILYFLVRSAIRELSGGKGQAQVLTDKNQMVQDPVCRIYVTRGSAVAESIGGQTYYFCSRVLFLQQGLRADLSKATVRLAA